MTDLGQKIIASLSDDWENLEQLYKMISLEYVQGSQESGNPCWKGAKEHYLLSEIADALFSLWADGYVQVRLDGAKPTEFTRADPSQVWRGWFSLTERGAKEVHRR